MFERLRRALPAIAGLTFFGAALYVLRIELTGIRWAEVARAAREIPAHRVGVAAVLTALNYATLTGYDFLALASVRRALPPARVALTSFVAFAIANTVGLAALSGASVRYRFYTRWGVTGDELARIVFSYSLTFWLGLLELAGASLVFGDFPLPARMAVVTTLGWVVMLGPLVFLVLAAVHPTAVRVRDLVLPIPSARLALAQLTLSSVEWSLAGAVLYVLLPSGSVPFLHFLGAFLASTFLGLASHVPGGVGVFESLMVVLLEPRLVPGELLPALMVFRVVYYFVPFAAGVAVLVTDELRQRRAAIARVGVVLGGITEELTPRVLAVLTFLAGVVLLLSGATPAVPGRLAVLERLFPVGVVETSHFAGSVAGAALLVLSQGIARRLDVAYYLTSFTIAGGVLASLLKGVDFEEALLLSVVLIVLWRARPAFDRRAAFFETRFSPEWIGSILAAVAASIWLGLFSFRHVAYSNQLWWQFEFGAEASRYLRASVGAAMVLLIFGLARLMAPAAPEVVLPDESDLASAGAVIAGQQSTRPYLVYLRDKALVFNDDRTGFVMYGVQGRTWIALGDPVGPPEVIADLVRRFLERCDDFGGVPVFYGVTKAYLHHYADFGLTSVKLGEEARVDLRSFSLDGGRSSRLRQCVRRLDRERAAFRIVEPGGVPAILPDLRRVSDDWLLDKPGAEKGFSLGYFDERYLLRFPVAVIEQSGRIVAFSNLWRGPGRHELSVDLMRYTHGAPTDVMLGLLVHLLLWGQTQEYAWFTLGMAPLSGFERSPAASRWTRLGAFVYEHAEVVYGFQGVRAYKEKFDPVWEPYYLAYPGGFTLPRILADLSARIAGGYGRIFMK
jgi:phosphatidylglycerol lysyltransferase